MFSDRMYEREEVVTGNQYPVTTGISSTIFVLVSLAFFILAFHAGGCSSPPDNCSEVDKCGGDVDGGNTDQPDGNTTSTDGGQTQPDGNNTDACAAMRAWMEDPAMFNCFQFDPYPSGEEVYTNECDPLLITSGDICQVRCTGVFTGPNPEDGSELLVNQAEHYFEYINANSEARYRCRQRI